MKPSKIKANSHPNRNFPLFCEFSGTKFPKLVLGGNNWELFLTFLSNGKASLTTNLVEGKIRTTATGRKNYGHSKSLTGAKDLAIIMSVVMSAIENGLNPLVYVPDVVEKIPHMPKDQLYTLSPDEYEKHYGGDLKERPKPGGGKHIGSDENPNVTDNAASAVSNEQTSDCIADSDNHQEMDNLDTGSSGGTNSQQKMQPDPEPKLPASIKENVDHRVISSTEDGIYQSECTTPSYRALHSPSFAIQLCMFPVEPNPSSAKPLYAHVQHTIKRGCEPLEFL